MNKDTNFLSDIKNLMFRTGAGILSRLGSQQLKDEITAAIELVKNAYDADATAVRIEFIEVERKKRLRIQDDGSGMTYEDLHNKWAFLATENKLQESRSPIFKRRRLGQKGVGRFAAEKLGSILLLRTRTKGESKVRQITFQWDQMSGDKELGDYKFDIIEKKPKAFEPNHGTYLNICDLRTNWTRNKMEKLRHQLCRLIDPETAATDFRIFFFTPWSELNGELKNPLPGKETHKIDFDIGADGTESVKRTYDSKAHSIKKEELLTSFGPIKGCLRYFGKGLSGSDRARGTDPRADWNVGVRIFLDGCRVRPYGEPGSEGDWLQIYRIRYLRGSRFRLKPHYLEGTIHITSDDNPKLRDTTGREGLDNNDEYNDFVEYVKDKIVQLSEIVRDEELKEERLKTKERYKKAMEPLTAGLNTLRSDQYKKSVDESDIKMKKRLTKPIIVSDIKNAHWECLDCKDSWKAPLEKTPSKCREFSVGRDGKPTNKLGCGSSNIQGKENIPRDESSKKEEFIDFDDMLSGAAAYVSGIQLKPAIDWEMGENDDEAEVRPERRELAINGRHLAFRAADILDGAKVVEGTEFESLKAVGALTVHVIDAASLAWGRWHYFREGEKLDELLICYAELKNACIQCISDIQKPKNKLSGAVN